MVIYGFYLNDARKKEKALNKIVFKAFSFFLYVLLKV